MAEDYDVTYNPTEVVRGMNNLVSEITESAIKFGDAFYEFNYTLSISWASPEAKKYEKALSSTADFISSTIQTINYILDRYDEGIACLTEVNDADPIVFPRVAEFDSSIFPMQEKLDGKVGIDKKLATEAKDKFAIAFEENINSYSNFHINIGLKDIMIEEEVSNAMIETTQSVLPIIGAFNKGLTKKIDDQKGVIDTSEKMAYEALVETVSSMDTIPEDNVEYKVCKEWLTRKEDLVKMVKDTRLVTLGPEADLTDEETPAPSTETSETNKSSDSTGETTQEEPNDSSSNLHSPTSMPAKASLGNGPVSVLQ